MSSLSRPRAPRVGIPGLSRRSSLSFRPRVEALEDRLVPSGGCVPPPAGLVSWWPGDGNTEDIVDSNAGTIVGSVTFPPGKVSQAFDFDGSGYIQIPDNSNLKPSQLTIDGWIKPVFSGRPAQTADVDTILAKFDPGGSGYELFVVMDPTFNFGGGGPGGTVPLGTPGFYLNVSGTSHQFFAPSPLPNDGQFHHIAASYDATTIRLYVDGVEVNGQPAPGAIVHAATADASIGFAPFIPRNSRAAIDEVDLFNRALAPSEIQAIVNAGSAGKCKPDCVPPPSGLIAWLPGNGNTDDIIGNHDGTLVNGATFGSGKVHEAFDFDGVNDYVHVPNTGGDLDVGSQVTVEYWMKSDPSNSMNTLQGLVTTDFYGIEISPGRDSRFGVNFFVNTDPSGNPASFHHTSDFAGGGFVVSAGQWHHVAGTYDGSSMKLYVDGLLRATTPESGIITPMRGISFLAIGSEDGRTNEPSVVGTRYFHGLIDEVDVFNRALSASEIAAIFNAGSAGKCQFQTVQIDIKPGASPNAIRAHDMVCSWCRQVLHCLREIRSLF